MKTTLFSIFLSFYSFFGYSQILGVYEFNGANDGGNLNVTQQPLNSLFGILKGNYFSYTDEFGFNESGLSVGYGSSIDTLDAYDTYGNSFFSIYLRTNSCNRIKIDSIDLGISHDILNDTFFVELRSSIDNYSSVLASHEFYNNFSSIRFNLSNNQLDSLIDVNFRFTLTGSDVQKSYLIDNLVFYGNDTTNVGPVTYYEDSDNDSYGAGSPLLTCVPPSNNYTLNNLDCNDANNLIHPGFIEYDACGDGFDNDCNGTIDDGFSICVCYGPSGSEDIDGDGYWTQDSHCPFDESLVDCADWDATIWTGCFEDYDGDGSFNIDDCDDNNASIYPDAPEILNNGIDENCDGNDAIVGILESSSNIFFVYPNPGKNMISIKVEKEFIENLKLMDLHGKVVAESFFYDENNKTFSINTSHIEVGIYHLVLSTRNANYILKWIKNE